MKKAIFIFTILALCISQISWAKKNYDKEFKKLYKETVAKLSHEKKDTVEFHVFRLNETAILSLVYEKSHVCPCNDKQCHGPRLTLSTNFGETKIFVFPNGYCFSETYYSQGEPIKIDPQKEIQEANKFKEVAKEKLLSFVE